MATPDPVPQRSTRHRVARLLRVAAAGAIIIAALAVALIARGRAEPHLLMLITTALGIGLAVLLATALMSVVLLYKRSGHDADAAAPLIERHEK